MSGYEIPEGVLVQDLDGDSVILHLESGRYYSLNETGSRMLALLGEGLDEEDICRRLAGDYDAPPERIRADLDRLLGELTDRGLVRPRD